MEVHTPWVRDKISHFSSRLTRPQTGDLRSTGDAIRIPANESLEWEVAKILFRPRGGPAASHWCATSELFPRVGFIVTNLSLPSRAVVRFYNKRGTAEQWIKEGKQATHWTRLSCHRFRTNEARLQLRLLKQSP